MSSGKGHHLVGGTEDELSWVEDERLVRANVHHPGQVRLVLRGVDDGVAVVVEQAEQAIEAHVHAEG